MSSVAPQTLLNEFLAAAEAQEELCAAGLDDTAFFYGLGVQVIKLAGVPQRGESVLITDPITKAFLSARTNGMPESLRVVVAGPDSGEIASAPGYLSCDMFTPDMRLVVLLSATTAVAIVGQEHQPEGINSFTGIWTVHRPSVLALLEKLAGNSADALIGQVADAADGGEDSARTAMKLMHVLAEQLTTRERMLARDKADLSSVLNILKAISARRRAHDILFVFVEQVARVVQCERCSIVRVWDDQPMGQVLASHEDESVYDRSIELAKYPELQEALALHHKLVIDDVSTHPLTAPYSQQLTAAAIKSLVVIPIVLRDEEVGTLVLRAARSTMRFSPQEVSFFEIVAEAAANALERAHLFDSIQRANARLERLAITDDLTSLYNHRYLRDRLEEEFQRAVRYRLPLSCMIFDVDNFKSVNDTYGHLHGDRVLQEIARRTAQSVRRSDTVARYGGEEFTVIMPQTDEEGALAQAERIRHEIAAEPVRAGASLIPITVSIGLAVLDSDQMKDTEGLVRAADQALYQAKHGGKNRSIVYKEPNH